MIKDDRITNSRCNEKIIKLLQEYKEIMVTQYALNLWIYYLSRFSEI